MSERTIETRVTYPVTWETEKQKALREARGLPVPTFSFIVVKEGVPKDGKMGG